MELRPYYSLNENIYFYRCDRSGSLRLSMLNALLSEMAGLAYSVAGMDHDWLWEHDCAFLLSRFHIRVLRMPRSMEQVTFTTWECEETNGAAFRRDFEVADQDGSLLVIATSDWIPVSPKTRRIIRLKNHTIPRCSVDRYVDLPSCQKLRLTEGEEAGSHKVVYSDIDGNDHMFNAWYADVVLNCLPEELQDRPVREYEVNFNREARLGDEIILTRLVEGDTVTVKGSVEGKDCFVARLSY